MPNVMPAYEVEVYASAARTATPTEVEVANTYNHPRALVFVDVTADPAAASVVFNIDTECHGATNNWFEIFDSAAVTATGQYVYAIGAGGETADLQTSYPVGRRLRFRPVHADADSMTYSVHVLFTN